MYLCINLKVFKMKFEIKGTEKPKSKISGFAHYLKNLSVNSLWLYKGLRVEIDPIVDYGSENVLIRWTNIDEGFNDKIIYHNLARFKEDFQLINA